MDGRAAAETSATTQQTGRSLAEALRSGRVLVPDHDLAGAELTVELLGAGESYAAWLVRAPDAELLFRFPRRPPGEMPAAMADEFAALQRVPERLGTRGIAVEDGADNVLGRRYLATTFVPGRVVAGTAWTQQIIACHTDQLARLHDASSGDAGAPLPPRDLAAELSRDFAG